MTDETPRPCGRAGPHQPHAWLSRKDLWCAGGGEPGSTAPPREKDGQQQSSS